MPIEAPPIYAPHFQPPSAEPLHAAVVQRDPDPGISAGVHWLRSSSLQPLTPTVGVVDEPFLAAENFRTGPNPLAGANGAVEFFFYLKKPAKVCLEIFSVTGRLVDRPLLEDRQSGNNFHQWRPRQPLAAGQYLAIINLTDKQSRQRLTNKITLLR